MRPLLNLALLGTAIVGTRGRVTPGLCFELKLAPGGRYSNTLGHQLEGIGPLLAAGVRQHPAAIVATHAPPMSYFEGAFQAVFPGTALVKRKDHPGPVLARLRHDRPKPPRGRGGEGEGTPRGRRAGGGGDARSGGRRAREKGGAASRPKMYRARQVRPRGQGEVQTGQGHLLQRAPPVLREQRVCAL